MDKAMVSSILIAAAGLCVAVLAVYLLAWYRGTGQAVAQTVAFAAWLVGHVFLAFNLRSERQPLFQVGFFSNRLMIVWGVAAVVFVLLATLVPPLQAVLKTASLSGAQWALITGAALAGTFWLEIRKLIAYRCLASG
jgi:Ca2+-transporting ATPase